MKYKNQALLIENPQIDFFYGGAVSVANSLAILPVLNELIPQFETVIVTMDWHPADHISFAANHPWRQIGQVIEAANQLIELKPIHCVQETFGAMIYPQLIQKDRFIKIYKGQYTSVEDHSAFYQRVHQDQTNLPELLKQKNIQHLSVAGMILEDNILNTIIDGLQLGYQLTLLKEASIGQIPKQSRENLWNYVESLGVKTK